MRKIDDEFVKKKKDSFVIKLWGKKKKGKNSWRNCGRKKHTGLIKKKKRKEKKERKRKKENQLKPRCIRGNSLDRAPWICKIEE